MVTFCIKPPLFAGLNLLISAQPEESAVVLSEP